MKILELNIDVFGGLKQKRLSLSDGLNVIEGENESGKSTLMLFIKFMLYGLPRKGQEERERSVSREEHCARGSMTLSFEGETYRIERSFTEGARTGSEKLCVYRLSDGKEVFQGSEPGEVFLKVPKEVFENSAFVGQMMCGTTGGKKGAEAIRNLLTTADEETDLSRIVEKLEKIRVGYRHRTGKGGRLPDMGAAIHHEKQKWERAVADGLRLTELEKKSEELALQCEQVEERLKSADAVLRQAAKIDLLGRFDALHEKKKSLSSLEREIEILRNEEGMDEHPIEERDAARLSTLADQLESAEHKESIARAEYEKVSHAADYDSEEAEIGELIERNGGTDAVFLRMDRLRKKKSALLALGLVFLLGGIAGAVLCVTTLELWLGAVALGAVALLGLLLLARTRSVSRSIKNLSLEYGANRGDFGSYLYACGDALRKKREFGSRLMKSEEALRLASDHLAELRRWMRAELDRFETEASATPETAREYAKQIREVLREYNALQTRKTVLKESIAADERALASFDETALRAEIAELGVNDRKTVDLSKAEQERKWVETQRELLRRKKEQVDVERISLAATVEDPMPIADRLSALQSDYVRAEEYYEALELALSALREAGDTMSGNVTPILGKRAGEIMEFLSDGRYAGFFAGNDLIPSLETEDGFRVPSDLLSGGTRDAAYLALRLSLMLGIYEGELPPLILDESLCQLDDSRMGRTVELLSKLCTTGLQCLLFTCQTRERSYCEQKNLSFRYLPLSMQNA